MARPKQLDMCPESCLGSIRDDVVNVKVDMAAVKITSNLVAKTTADLHDAILGKDGIATKLGIIWDRQERHSKVLTWIGIFATTVFATTLLKMVNEYLNH